MNPHRGQHTNCRQCGTNLRSRRLNPRALRNRLSVGLAALGAPTCATCRGTGWAALNSPSGRLDVTPCPCRNGTLHLGGGMAHA